MTLLQWVKFLAYRCSKSLAKVIKFGTFLFLVFELSREVKNWFG